jgi:glycosyltransferase involved in cell wall biosynthesis
MKIRVLEVLATLRRAGAERVATSLARGLDKERFETAVVSLYPPFEGGFEPDLAAHGVPVTHLGKRPGFDPRMWPRLKRLFRDFRPDIVHTHSYVLRYAWPVGEGRIVHTVHNLARREVELFGRVIHRFAFRRGVVPVAISAEIARSFERVYGFAPAAVIPNGAEVRAGFRPEARQRWRAANGFGEDDLLLVSLARLEPQKNPLGLIDAFARAAPTGHLVMAGEGSLLKECRRRAERRDLAGRVHLAGLCRDVPELLSACDLFVLASDWEGSPVAVIEAMAARLPVVATAVGGVPELVDDGLTGMLVPARDPSAMAGAMTILARDPERRRRMGEAAAGRALRFDVQTMIDAYAALFERLSQEARSCRA